MLGRQVWRWGVQYNWLRNESLSGTVLSDSAIGEQAKQQKCAIRKQNNNYIKYEVNYATNQLLCTWLCVPLYHLSTDTAETPAYIKTQPDFSRFRQCFNQKWIIITCLHESLHVILSVLVLLNKHIIWILTTQQTQLDYYSDFRKNIPREKLHNAHYNEPFECVKH